MQLLLMLLVVGGDGVLCLLLHALDEVLHVLECIDLRGGGVDEGERLQTVHTRRARRAAERIIPLPTC